MVVDNNNKKLFLEEIGAYLKRSGFQPRPTAICTERKTFCKVEMNFGRKYEHRDLHRNNFFLQYRSESFVEINQHRDLQKNKYFLQSRNESFVESSEHRDLHTKKFLQSENEMSAESHHRDFHRKIYFLQSRYECLLEGNKLRDLHTN